MTTKHIPNILTLLRIILIVPFFITIYQRQYIYTFYFFIIASATDGLDGWLARHFCWQSPIGSFLDPLADKLLTTSSFISLTILGELPWWIVILVLLRDITLSLGVIAWYMLIGKKIEFQPTFISKINTVLQLTLITICLFQVAFTQNFYYVKNILIFFTAITTVGSYLDYVLTWSKKAYFLEPLSK